MASVDHRRRRELRASVSSAIAPGAGTACGTALDPNTHASLLPFVSVRSLAPNMAISHWPPTSVQ